MRSALLLVQFKKGLRIILAPLLPFIRSLRNRPVRLLAGKNANALHSNKGVSVCYLTGQFPARPALRTEVANGGAVKLTFLAESFPHSFPHASLLYTVSSVNHVAKSAIIRKARDNGLKIVLNQNGVAFHAWHGRGWEESNKRLRDVFEQADYIIYQSKFCQQSASKFLGSTTAPSQIIYNPVDTDLYKPSRRDSKHSGPVLLLGGNQYQKYRFECAIQVLHQTLALLPNARLIITGVLWGENQKVTMDIAQKYLQKYSLQNRVEFTGSYSQAEALQIFQRADILIHTQFNDSSPNLISEALASGLPVVYSASGGVPELVGQDAGIGIPVEQSWERISTPDPTQMAVAVQKIWGNLPSFAEAARQQAVEQFPLEIFIQAHREIFASLVE